MDGSLRNTYNFCTYDYKELRKKSLHVHTKEEDSLKYHHKEIRTVVIQVLNRQI